MERSNKYRHLFSDEEWDFFLRLGAALHCPTEKKEFFAAVIEGKQRDPHYEISGYVPRKKFVGQEVCREVLGMLSVHSEKEDAS